MELVRKVCVIVRVVWKCSGDICKLHNYYTFRSVGKGLIKFKYVSLEGFGFTMNQPPSEYLRLLAGSSLVLKCFCTY